MMRPYKNADISPIYKINAYNKDMRNNAKIIVLLMDLGNP